MPMWIFKEVLSRPKCEVLINFMDSYINRFCKRMDLGECIELLYGSEEWRSALEPGLYPQERRDRLLNIYKSTLPGSSKLHFALRDRNDRHIYHLIFVSNHSAGLVAMKRAMAGASQEMDVFVFSEKHSFRLTKGVVDVTKREYKAYCVKKLNVLFRSVFHSERVWGRDLVDYVLYETPYIFNYKNEMKKTLQDVEVQRSRSFGDTVYFFESPPGIL
jgi:hypothetical protein